MDDEGPAAHTPRFFVLGPLSVELAGAAVPLGGRLRRALLASWYVYMFHLRWLPELLYGPQRHGGRQRLINWLASYGQVEALAERDAGGLSSPGAFTAALNWYRAAPLTLPWRMFAKVKVPTLYVWSDGDKAVTETAACRAGRYVTGPYRFEVIKGISHWIPEQCPEAVVRLVSEHLRENP